MASCGWVEMLAPSRFDKLGVKVRIESTWIILYEFKPKVSHDALSWVLRYSNER